MTAPGANLDFVESRSFRVRIEGNQEVRTAFQEQIKNNPRAGRHICGPLYVMELTVKSRLLVYLYGMTGQKVNVAHVFDVASEEAKYQLKLEEMQKSYCGDSQKRRKP